MNWADQLADPVLSGVDWYEMRCKLLHQGRTIAKKSKYTKFVFGQPAADGTKDHKRVDGSEIYLDVGELAHEMVGGIRRWFVRLRAQPAEMATTNVERHLQPLVKSVVANPGAVAAVFPGGIVFQPPTLKTSS